ncbi:FhaA domain-containing protein [Streptomyces sp. NPDC005533]|uniref:FhaA domain-containing protein n=1 Tax=Streptomyces sp. NPDC005533 TaxID=3364723 RepID=UPI0036C251D6
MEVLKRLEQRLEDLVNAAFAKLFKSEVHSVEIAGALQRECDNNATIWNRERTVVPNDFVITLSASDYECLRPYFGPLSDELAGLVRDYAKQKRFSFMGPVKIHLEKAEELNSGRYRVRSCTLVPPASQPQQLHHPPQTAYSHPPARAQPVLGVSERQPGDRASVPVDAAVRHWIEINGTRHQISRPTLVLGRGTEADVRIHDPGVSRRHCEIRTGRPSTIRDIGSTNGIVVDGRHTTRTTLRNGSQIVVGSTTIIYRQAEG